MSSKQRRPLGRYLGWTALAGVAGLVLVTGAVLTWSTLSLDTVHLAQTGLDSGGGVVTSALGLVLLATTVTRISSYTRAILPPVAILVGVLSGLVIGLYVLSYSFPAETDSSAPVSSLGSGVLITVLGAITAVVSGIGLVVMDRGRDRGGRRR